LEITDQSYDDHTRQTTLEGQNMVQNTITWTIDNVFKELDISSVDDTTYKRLENISSQYEYIDSDLLEQMIEAELIIILETD
jgi:hypothetical protein